jgi:signal transduction histidine kinase
LTVLQAGNGKLALAQMASQVPNLIISDIMMPEMGGYEFLQHVRKNDDWKSIPFIFLSAKGDAVDIRTGQLSDADLYITKPFASHDLLELIKTQLDRTFDRRFHAEQQIDTFKKTILQTLNHEFRTPLTYVTAYYDLLASSVDYASSDNYQEYLRGIQAGCQRLTRLIEDFIMVMDLRSGAARERFTQEADAITQINDLILRVIEAKAAIAAEKRIQIHFDPCPVSYPIWGVPAYLQNALERVLDNAIKFTAVLKADAQVWVSCTLQEHTLQLTIRDEGPGLPEQMHRRIFDLFVQYNRTLIEQQGAGIGLTIAQGLINLHNGQITVSNGTPTGTAVTITLPLQHTTTTTTHPQQRPATILLVEDDVNLLEGLADLLALQESSYTFLILTAENGEAALERMQETNPDIILSDIMMPKMDGYTFLQTVRQNPQWLNIPFIFLTAKGERRDEFLAYKLGVEEYIKKPYESEDVIRLVEKQLAKYFHSQEQVTQDFESLKRNILNLISPDFMLPLDLVREHSDRLSMEIDYVGTEAELMDSLRGIQTGSELLNKIVEDFIALAELETDEALTAYQLQSQPIANFGYLLFEQAQAISANQPIHIECPLNGTLPMLFGNSDLLLKCLERAVMIMTLQNDPSQTSQLRLTSQFDPTANTVDILLVNAAPFPETLWVEIANILNHGSVPSQSNMPPYIPSLLIINGYVRLHHGVVQMQNHPETGAEFTIRLPVYEM